MLTSGLKRAAIRMIVNRLEDAIDAAFVYLSMRALSGMHTYLPFFRGQPFWQQTVQSHHTENLLFGGDHFARTYSKFRLFRLDFPFLPFLASKVPLVSSHSLTLSAELKKRKKKRKIIMI